MNKFKLLPLLLINCLLLSPLQGKVLVKLQPFPPNDLSIDFLWNLEVRNTDEKTYMVYLRGEIFDDKGTLVNKARTSVIKVPHGQVDITAGQVSEVLDIWYNEDYERAIQKDGRIPDGNYKACVFVIDSESGDELAQQCMRQIVRNFGFMRLISPMKSSEVKERAPLFSWTDVYPSPSDKTFDLKISEIEEGKTPEQSIATSPPIFEKNDITSFSLLYPFDTKPLEVGKNYAWQVTAMVNDKEIAKSDVFNFLYKGAETGEATQKTLTSGDHTSIVDFILDYKPAWASKTITRVSQILEKTLIIPTQDDDFRSKVLIIMENQPGFEFGFPQLTSGAKALIDSISKELRITQSIPEMQAVLEEYQGKGKYALYPWLSSGIEVGMDILEVGVPQIYPSLREDTDEANDMIIDLATQGVMGALVGAAISGRSASSSSQNIKRVSIIGAVLFSSAYAGLGPLSDDKIDQRAKGWYTDESYQNLEDPFVMWLRTLGGVTAEEGEKEDSTFTPKYEEEPQPVEDPGIEMEDVPYGSGKKLDVPDEPDNEFIPDMEPYGKPREVPVDEIEQEEESNNDDESDTE